MNGIGVVQTKQGKVSGVVKDGITVFRQIPYAEAPVGELRWHAPREHTPWEGIRACDTFRNICWQLPGFVGQEALETYPQSEDCLYLNIWTPAQTAKEKLPVLFWIHGGGFQGGVGHEALYDGTSLAKKGIIVVSLNYRLGAFGFLSHPELKDEDDGNGNFGLLDIIFALKWVKRNIEAFGGDPSCITIDGQSAGGMAVGCLLTSPLTAGLFQRAIIQSGGPALNLSMASADSEQTGVQLQEKLGCHSLAELRKADPAALRDASSAFSITSFSPHVDGKILPQTPYEAFLKGEIAQVPLILGSNSHENLSAPVFTADRQIFLQEIEKFCGADKEMFEKLYDTEKEDITLTAGGDMDFANVRDVLGQIKRAHSAPVYQYYFSKPIILKNGQNLGAPHSGELFYVFHTLSCMGGSTLDGEKFETERKPEDYFLSDDMGTYWSSFAKNGNPNHPGLPKWKEKAEEEGFLHFGERGCSYETELRKEKTDFWAKIWEEKRR